MSESIFSEFNICDIKKYQALVGNKSRITSIVHFKELEIMVISTVDNEIMLWNFSKSESVYHYKSKAAGSTLIIAWNEKPGVFLGFNPKDLTLRSYSVQTPDKPTFKVKIGKGVGNILQLLKISRDLVLILFSDGELYVVSITNKMIVTKHITEGIFDRSRFVISSNKRSHAYVNLNNTEIEDNPSTMLSLYDYTNNEFLKKFENNTSHPIHFFNVFVHESTEFIVCGGNEFLFVYNSSSGQILKTISLFSIGDVLTSMHFQPSSQLLFAGTQSGNLYVYRMKILADDSYFGFEFMNFINLNKEGNIDRILYERQTTLGKDLVFTTSGDQSWGGIMESNKIKLTECLFKFSEKRQRVLNNIFYENRNFFISPRINNSAFFDESNTCMKSKEDLIGIANECVQKCFEELVDEDFGKNEDPFFKDFVKNHLGSSVFSVFHPRESLLYFGESAGFPDSRMSHGYGIMLIRTKKKKNMYVPLYRGSFKNGLRDGFGEVFELIGKKRNQYITSKIFEGYFRNGLRHGKGVEYVYDKSRQYETILFEGIYRFGKRCGKGELVDTKKNMYSFVRGIWKDNKLVKAEDTTFECPIVPYESINGLLTEDNIQGRGNWGIVYRVRTEDILELKGVVDPKEHEFVVLKLMKQESQLRKSMYLRMARRGIELARKVKSEYIAAPLALIQGSLEVGYVIQLCKSNAARLYFFWGNGGETLTMDEKIRLIYGTAVGLKDLHDLDLIHRCLGWQNVLIGLDGIPKITDFDVLKEDEHKWRLKPIHETSKIGIRGYFAPESFSKSQYSCKSDVYQFSLMIYSILFEMYQPLMSQYTCSKCGQKVADITGNLDHHVVECDLRPLVVKKEMEEKKIPGFLVDLMVRGWDKDPEKRPNMKEIVETIRMNKGYDIEILLKIPETLNTILKDQKLCLSETNFEALELNIRGKSEIFKNFKNVMGLSCEGSEKQIKVNVSNDEDLKNWFESLRKTNEQSMKNANRNLPILELELNGREYADLKLLQKELELIESELLLQKFVTFVEGERGEMKDTFFFDKERTETEISKCFEEFVTGTCKEYYVSQIKQRVKNPLKYEAIMKERMGAFFSQFRMIKNLGSKSEYLYYGTCALKQKEGETEDDHPVMDEYLPNGSGVLFLKKDYLLFRDSKYTPVYIGQIREGKREGLGKEVDGKTKHLLYEGEYVQGERDGKGLIYTFLPRIGGYVILYEGLFSGNLRHGRGEEYEARNGKVTRGVWNRGVLDESTVFQFSCPIVNSKEFQKHLNDSNLVGTGGFGNVYKLRVNWIPALQENIHDSPLDINDTHVAVKVIKVQNSSERKLFFRMIRRGVGLCSTINSPYVLNVIAVFNDPKSVGYITELCDLSVDKLIGRRDSIISKSSNSYTMDMETKKKILLETALGMRSFHESDKKVMHRDLKWANVMMKNGIVKITDFDTLKEDEQGWKLKHNLGASSRIGTTGFLAPEVFSGKDYSLACDVYAFGMMIYSLLWELNNPFITQFQCPCGSLVENILETMRLDQHVHSCNFRPLLDPKEIERLPRFLIDIMIQCWDKDPFQRPSFEDICLRFQFEKDKSFSQIRMCFPSHKGVFMKELNLFMVKPYQIDKIRTWLEKKFGGSKVIKIEHSILGLVQDDEDLKKIIQKQERPLLDVELDRIDEDLLVIFGEEEMSNKKISPKEFQKLEKENERLKLENERLKEKKCEKCSFNEDMVKVLETEIVRLKELVNKYTEETEGED